MSFRTGFVRKVRRLKLCTGETVQRIGTDLVVIGTGERLELVESRSRRAAAVP
jgi:hypothetical protein